MDWEVRLSGSATELKLSVFVSDITAAWAADCLFVFYFEYKKSIDSCKKKQKKQTMYLMLRQVLFDTTWSCFALSINMECVSCSLVKTDCPLHCLHCCHFNQVLCTLKNKKHYSASTAELWLDVSDGENVLWSLLISDQTANNTLNISSIFNFRFFIIIIINDSKQRQQMSWFFFVFNPWVVDTALCNNCSGVTCHHYSRCFFV